MNPYHQFYHFYVLFVRSIPTNVSILTYARITFLESIFIPAYTLPALVKPDQTYAFIRFACVRARDGKIKTLTVDRKNFFQLGSIRFQTLSDSTYQVQKFSIIYCYRCTQCCSEIKKKKGWNFNFRAEKDGWKNFSLEYSLPGNFLCFIFTVITINLIREIK